MRPRPAALHQQNENETHSHQGNGVKSVEARMARSETRPVVTLRSTAGTGQGYVTRKSRRNNPDRLVLRKFDPVVGQHVLFREER
jgi:large subunit ribosomal protein L33